MKYILNYKINRMVQTLDQFHLNHFYFFQQDTVIRLSKMFDLSKESSTKGRRSPCQQCNMCIILGLLAEKLAGPSSVAMLTQGTLEYLVANLVSDYYYYYFTLLKINYKNLPTAYLFQSF